MYFKEQPLSLQNPFLQQAFTRIETAPSQESQIILIAPHLVVGLTGLEPVTPRLSSACSNQLSYKPDHLSLSFSSSQHPPTRHILLYLVELRRLELLT